MNSQTSHEENIENEKKELEWWIAKEVVLKKLI